MVGFGHVTCTRHTDISHGHDTQTRHTDISNGHVTRTHHMDMSHGHITWTCYMDTKYTNRYCKHPEEGQWYKFNDNQVAPPAHITLREELTQAYHMYSHVYTMSHGAYQ